MPNDLLSYEYVCSFLRKQKQTFHKSQLFYKIDVYKLHLLIFFLPRVIWAPLSPFTHTIC